VPERTNTQAKAVYIFSLFFLHFFHCPSTGTEFMPLCWWDNTSHKDYRITV